MSERGFEIKHIKKLSGSILRQDFDTSQGLWKARIVDFPTGYSRGMLRSWKLQYNSAVAIFEIKQVEDGLSFFSENIHVSTKSFDDLENFLRDSGFAISNVMTEVIPTGHEQDFYTREGPGGRGPTINMVEAAVLNEKLFELEKQNDFLAMIKDLRRTRRGRISTTVLEYEYASRGQNFVLGQPSSLRLESLLLNAAASLGQVTDNPIVNGVVYANHLDRLLEYSRNHFILSRKS